MVERPIKKSERAERSTGEDQSEDLQERSVRKNTGERDRGKGRDDRGKGRGDRGKGRGDREESKPAVPLALMRGPKPAPKVEAPKVKEGGEEEVTPEVTEEA